MALETVWDSRLGYSRLDLAVGDWEASNDVAVFTAVRQPELDQKFYVRELLRIFGKRFATPLAALIWHEIENSQAEIARLYGPPTGQIGLVPFEQTAREWYTTEGRYFERNWYLASSIELNYARTGRELVQGRWLRWFQADLLYFVETGFSSAEILKALRQIQHRWWRLFRLPGPTDGRNLNILWVRLAATLLGFEINEVELDRVLAEVAEHASRLSRKYRYPVNPAQAAIDYFRRLELGQLGPQILLS